jgi:hypothetical protein
MPEPLLLPLEPPLPPLEPPLLLPPKVFPSPVASVAVPSVAEPPPSFGPPPAAVVPPLPPQAAIAVTTLMLPASKIEGSRGALVRVFIEVSPFEKLTALFSQQAAYQPQSRRQ